MADVDCLLRRQVAAHSALMAAIAGFTSPLLALKVFFYCICLPTLRFPHHAYLPPPHLHDGRSFFHFVMLITEYYARKNVGPFSMAGLVLGWVEGGRSALIRHLAFPVLKARAHSSGVFVYWRRDDFYGLAEQWNCRLEKRFEGFL
jgi:hypothetical protein